VRKIMDLGNLWYFEILNGEKVRWYFILGRNEKNEWYFVMGIIKCWEKYGILRNEMYQNGGPQMVI